MRTACGLVAIGLLGSGCSGGIGDTASKILGLESSSSSDPNGEIVLYTRSPLVLPPDYNLRPPGDKEKAREQLGENWPVDPDVRAREIAAKERRERRDRHKENVGKVVGNEKLMTPEEIEAGRKAAGTGGNPGATVRTVAETEAALTPAELRRGGKDHELKEEDRSTAQQPGQGTGVPVEQQTSEKAEAKKDEDKGFFDRIF